MTDPAVMAQAAAEEIAKKQHDAETKQTEMKNIDRQLERLKSAQSQIESLKRDVDAFKMNINEHRLRVIAWHGERYKKYDQQTSVELVASIKEYHDRLDGIHDKINTKITELNNKRQQAFWLWQQIMNTISTLKTQVANLFN